MRICTYMTAMSVLIYLNNNKVRHMQRILLFHYLTPLVGAMADEPYFGLDDDHKMKYKYTHDDG